MPRYSEYTLEELLELEDEWWAREDETDRRWVSEGVSLFTNLSSKDRDNIGYKEVKAYLLILQGESLKIKDRSYERAIKAFQQVGRLEPENARAHYRLGFLYFYEEE
ncbi:tetratricopeptide repeat protein [Alkalihalophilus sp. As8PL]|uniref:Tetratricopeptide repeat protein n=1 Tax=Alkalihalophilus sp. As8PL TaxID=3237103 RepID=A0AB39BVI4_9BACI